MTYESPFHMRMRDIYKKKEEDDSKKLHHIKNVEGKLMHQTTHHKTPNMMDAYKKVQQSKHEPTVGEVNYRQFTTSSFVKH